jgi:TRAP-type mannitol/chloroaromatic compound transport system substrate-binding protein
MKKIMSFVLAAALLVGLLAACAAPAPAPAPSPAPTASPAPTPSPSPAPSQAAEKYTWQIACPYPETMNLFDQLSKFCDALGEASGGRITATPYGASVLVPALSELENAESGTIDGYFSGSVLYPGRLGEGALPFGASFPGGPGPYEYITWWYWGGGAELEQELYDSNNADIHVVGPAGGVGPELFGWFNKKITSLDDFKGLKFRTIGLWGDTLASLGASVVTMSGGELYQALERGVIDAFELSIPSIDYPLGFYEIAKYVVIPGVHQPHSILEIYIRGESWRKLSPELQKLVEEVAAAETTKGLSMVNYQDADAWEKIKATGVEIVVLPKSLQDEIVAAAAKVMDDYGQKDPFFAEVVGSQLDFIDYYRPWQVAGNPAYYK